jgi:tRNA G18 (ribose-2'-O)-methylase SpoU
VGGVLHVSSRNARFQQWQALLGNRVKRQRSGEFLVQGVRPISLAAESGWRIRALIYDAERPLSDWAANLLRDTGASRVAMAPGLLAELAEKPDGSPELVAVVEVPRDELDRIPAGDRFLGVVLDRPARPGNIGAVIRSADAFGASGLIVTGHAADIYDPRAVRASTGSLFALPVVRCPSHREVAAWLAAQRERGCPVLLAAADEKGEADIYDVDLTGPVLLLVGNEGTGLAAAWRQLSDVIVRIPMAGAASSLNAASAAAVALYEISRQRILAGHRTASRPGRG